MLLLRSSLLRRYPNAIIYLTPALTGALDRPPLPDIFPIFNGALEPDINFFGFPLTPAAAVGSGGQSRLLRGDPGTSRPSRASVSTSAWSTRCSPPGATSPSARSRRQACRSKGRTWGKNSAHMAEITRRLPVRITIHASQLVALT